MTSMFSKAQFRTFLKTKDRKMTLEKLLKRKTAGSWLVERSNERVRQFIVANDFKLFGGKLTFTMTALRRALRKAFARMESIDCFKSFPHFKNLIEQNQASRTVRTRPLIHLVLSRTAICQALNAVLKKYKNVEAEAYCGTFIGTDFSALGSARLANLGLPDYSAYARMSVENGLFELANFAIKGIRKERPFDAMDSDWRYGKDEHCRFAMVVPLKRFLLKKLDGQWRHSASEALRMFKILETSYKTALAKLPQGDMWLATLRGLFDKPLLMHVLEKRQALRVRWEEEGNPALRDKVKTQIAEFHRRNPSTSRTPEEEASVSARRQEIAVCNARKSRVEPRSWLAGANVTVELCEFIESYWDTLAEAVKVDAFSPRFSNAAMAASILSFDEELVKHVARRRCQLLSTAPRFGGGVEGRALILAVRHAPKEFIEFLCEFIGDEAPKCWKGLVFPSTYGMSNAFKPRGIVYAPRFASTAFTNYSKAAPLNIACNMQFIMERYPSEFKTPHFLRGYQKAVETHVSWSALRFPARLDTIRIRYRANWNAHAVVRTDVQYAIFEAYVRPLFTALPPRRLQKTFSMQETVRLLQKCDERVECVICLEFVEYDSVHVLQCGHRFCETCIQQVKQPARCPCCRVPFILKYED